MPSATSQGGALIHIYEELAQHRGQMEVRADVMLADWARFCLTEDSDFGRHQVARHGTIEYTEPSGQNSRRRHRKPSADA